MVNKTKAPAVQEALERAALRAARAAELDATGGDGESSEVAGISGKQDEKLRRAKAMARPRERVWSLSMFLLG